MSALVRIDGAVPAADRIDSLGSPHRLFHDEGLTVAGMPPAEYGRFSFHDAAGIMAEAAIR